MMDIEWNGKPLKDNSVSVNLKDETQIKDAEDHAALNLIKYGLDGYIDGTNAFKVINPNKIIKNKKLTVTSHAAKEEGGNKMSDSFDGRYHDLKEDLRESERRMSQDVRDREQRFEKAMEKYSQESKEREERFMKNIEDIKDIVANSEKNRKSTTIAMWTLAITTFIGIAAMVITVAVSV